jgi:hypothetical protein
MVFSNLMKHRDQDPKGFAVAKIGLKIDLNLCFSCKPDHKDFYRFCSSLLKYFLYNIMAESMDETRIRVLQHCLAGEALS